QRLQRRSFAGAVWATQQQPPAGGVEVKVAEAPDVGQAGGHQPPTSGEPFGVTSRFDQLLPIEQCKVVKPRHRAPPSRTGRAVTPVAAAIDRPRARTTTSRL